MKVYFVPGNGVNQLAYVDNDGLAYHFDSEMDYRFDGYDISDIDHAKELAERLERDYSLSKCKTAVECRDAIRIFEPEFCDPICDWDEIIGDWNDERQELEYDGREYVEIGLLSPPQESFAKMVEIYESTRETGPKQTAKLIIDEIGIENAKSGMAAAITVKKWDGRISKENKEFWGKIGEEKGFYESMRLYGIDRIHPAHLDQLADSLREYIAEPARKEELNAKTAQPAQTEHYPFKVTVTGEQISPKEIDNYIEYAQKKNPGNTLAGLEIRIDGDHADLRYTYKQLPFERIRRITGYLVGTLDRFNDAKKAEVEDRVKHSIVPEEDEDIYLDEDADDMEMEC